MKANSQQQKRRRTYKNKKGRLRQQDGRKCRGSGDICEAHKTRGDASGSHTRSRGSSSSSGSNGRGTNDRICYGDARMNNCKEEEAKEVERSDKWRLSATEFNRYGGQREDTNEPNPNYHHIFTTH